MRIARISRVAGGALVLTLALTACASGAAPTPLQSPPPPNATPLSAPSPTRTTAAIALISPLASPLATVSPAPAPAVAPGLRRYSYRVLNSYPHDPQAFTQGLVFDNGRMFESTGLRGRSSLRETDLQTGAVIRKQDVQPAYFAEGLALVGNRLIQLTWQEQTGFVYEKDTFAQLATWSYPTEGWGLAYDGKSLVMSDGSAQIRFLNPEKFTVERFITVTLEGAPVERLNELEIVDGELWANVWQTDQIVRIDPATGAVTGLIDLTGLLSETDRAGGVDVLNGIAYDPAAQRLYVTGKLWPKLFEIEVIEQN